MGYQISYDSISLPEIRNIKRGKCILSIILVLAIVFSAIAVHSTALPWVQEYLLLSDQAVTAAALDELVDDLKSGSSLLDAITAFCKEIMSHAPNIR